MKNRMYDYNKDKEAAFQIWLECGWVENEDKDKKAFDEYFSKSKIRVTEHEGSAECLVLSSPGTMKFNEQDLKLSAITGVTVSRLLRKQGIAPKLLASAIKEDIKNGAHVVGLGMFEQGFYNRLGFATMAYENWYSFDPAKLKIYKKGGIPQRIAVDDYLEAHRAYNESMQLHGYITFDHPELMKASMMFCKNGFGLGYKEDGKLSHYIWFETSSVEEGPYTVEWMAYENWDQFLELLGIIKSLEEQVRSVRMKEPSFIQLQDFLDRPFQLRTITEKSKFESSIKAIAYQQLRIGNLEKCIEAVKLDESKLEFNLSLVDPINEYLETNEKLDTCQGDFFVSLGTKSSVTRGFKKDLPLIHGSINGFSRLWIGVLPASTIHLVEDLHIDEELIESLNKIFYKRYAKSNMDY